MRLNEFKSFLPYSSSFYFHSFTVCRILIYFYVKGDIGLYIYGFSVIWFDGLLANSYTSSLLSNLLFVL